MTKTVYTIPPDAAFIDRLAEGLWDRAESDPFKLSEMLVLLPTRRACRYLRMALPRIIGTRATLLPRMQPLGDLDEDELYFAETGAANIPPAISPLRRQLLLAQLIRKKDSTMPLDQAAQLAEALGQLLNEVQTERQSFSNLEKLAPGEYAKHWEQTIEFLKIVTDAWPKILTSEGCIDPARRRNLVIQTQAEAWRAHPPAYPVIAAGSTGSLPATRDLLDVIAGLPEGSVILPGLDNNLDEEAWQVINESHPQFTIKQLLEKLGVNRTSVKMWPTCAGKAEPRVRLLQESMRPAETTEAWRTLNAKKIPAEATNGLSRLTLDNAQDEAQAIALLMRATLEQPQKTATLITADRALAERVAAQLARWDITANDSAGASLATQPVGSFLLDILAVADPHASPVDYLSLLKHPLAAFGLDSAVCRSQAREAEMLVWRASNGNEKETKQIRSWLEELKQKLHPLQKHWRNQKPLIEWIALHRDLAELCAASDTESGDARLWNNEDGEAAAKWLDEWLNAAAGFPLLNGSEYASLFAGLLRTVKMRPSYGQHPRLSILGPLEARLLQADLTILGGLSEGSWPLEATVDPWMSRPMKHAFGLPLPEQRIGLSAHDFVQLASGPEVVLTRARRAGNAPTVPSRFLLQLETILQALGQPDALGSKEPWAEWAWMLDRPEKIAPINAPSPRPPAASRPQKLHVTEIGTWRRNPYAIYAKHVLRLRKLEPLEQDATAADKGTIIHKALESFLRQYPDTLPLHALDELLKLGRAAFAPYKDEPQAVAFWWPRFVHIAGWFIEQEHERRAAGIKNIKAEAEGSITLKNGFTLKGRADRIDKLRDGTLAIIDYKTGGLPTQAEIRAGYDPQLPLLALIASKGGFKDVAAVSTAILSYWKLSGGTEPAKEQSIQQPLDTLVASALAGLENLITQFADPDTPYEAMPKPGLQPRFDDYIHLARLAEWGRTAEDA